MNKQSFRRAASSDAGTVRDIIRAAHTKRVAAIGREPKPMTANYEQVVIDMSSIFWKRWPADCADRDHPRAFISVDRRRGDRRSYLHRPADPQRDGRGFDALA
jgi:hypothetical protein